MPVDLYLGIDCSGSMGDPAVALHLVGSAVLIWATARTVVPT